MTAPDSGATPAFNSEEARRHLLILGLGDASTVFCFQTFGERPDVKGRDEYSHQFHGTADDALPRLQDLNGRGAAVYVTVNQTDGRGREAQNILRARASFIDHDREKDGELASELLLEPTLTVFTGHGDHHYWIHPAMEPIAGHRECQVQLAKLYKSDSSVIDAARVMRIAGSVNWKSVPVQARILSENLAQTCTREAVLVGHGLLGNEFDRSYSHKKNFPPANHEPILEGCSWYRACKVKAATLGYNDWFSQLQIAVRCINGRILGHELSAPYPRYTEAETDKKLDQAGKIGPPTCGYVEKTLRHAGCATCPHRGKVKSPIVLGSTGSQASMTDAEARTILIAALEKLAVGDTVGFMDQATFTALAQLQPEERAQWEVRIRTIIAGKKLGKILLPRQLTTAIKTAVEKAKSARQKQSTTPSELPTVVMDERPFRDVVDEARAALVHMNQPVPTIFVQAGNLCRIIPDPLGIPLINQFDSKSLKLQASRAADFTTQKGKHVAPPTEVLDSILTLGEWKDFPSLAGIIPIPIARADGSFHTTPGYDTVSRLYYTVHGGDAGPSLPTVMDAPTDQDVANAVKVLWTPFAEFPWHDTASRANVFALLLTLLLRPAIDGNVPLFILLANLQGSGKTLVLELIVMLVFGSEYWSTFPYQDREDEMRKRIMSALLAGRPVNVIDNVEGTINSPSLASVVTSRRYSDRLLGTNDSPTIDQNAVWMFNGNNITTGDDLNRRGVLLEMRSPDEHPFDRTNFKIPNVRKWVKQHRLKLLAALMILVRHWHLRGCPPAKQPATLGSFEEWVHMISGILDNAGVTGFLANADRMRELNEGLSTQWGGFLKALYLHFGEIPFTVHIVCENIPSTRDGSARASALADALPEELASERERGQGVLLHAMGNGMKKIVNTPRGGFTLLHAGMDKVHNVKRWRVVCVDSKRLQEPYRSLVRLIAWLDAATWWALPENSLRTREDDHQKLWSGAKTIDSYLEWPALPDQFEHTDPALANLDQWLSCVKTWLAIDPESKDPEFVVRTRRMLIDANPKPS